MFTATEQWQIDFVVKVGKWKNYIYLYTVRIALDEIGHFILVVDEYII